MTQQLRKKIEATHTKPDMTKPDMDSIRKYLDIELKNNDINISDIIISYITNEKHDRVMEELKHNIKVYRLCGVNIIYNRKDRIKYQYCQGGYNDNDLLCKKIKLCRDIDMCLIQSTYIEKVGYNKYRLERLTY